jgi:hypothetical protein
MIITFLAVAGDSTASVGLLLGGRPSSLISNFSGTSHSSPFRAVAILHSEFIGRCYVDYGSFLAYSTAAPPHPCFAVVLVLSKEFISKQCAMEELQLLLHYRKMGSTVKVLPVYYDLNMEELVEDKKLYRMAMTDAAAGGALLKTMSWAQDLNHLPQWLKNLEELGGITSFHPDRPGRGLGVGS